MKLLKYAMLPFIALSCFACSDDDESAIKNDMIKKTVSPAIAGEKIEFAYAMGTTNGRINKAEAVASITGATSTGFELHSWFTAQTGMDVNGVHYGAGEDVPIQTVKDASTDGSISTANLMEKVDAHYINPTIAIGTTQTDLIAATLRYNFVVPEDAKGKTFSITFTAVSSTGDRVSYKTPNYKISKMDMKRLIELENEGACYFSIEDMKAYTKEEVNALNLSGKIDFIYNYQAKLNDFDYLIQNFYQVDNTTTINSSQLNAEELLSMDLTIKTPADQPQILIYHTHSQEMFADSDPNDVMTGVMGTGEYLTSLLQEKYGFQVMHHMGQYDVGDRDHAYANAEGPIEQLLAENPSIEVVIDLHRDAVDKHMVREVNGVQMAPIMFFNGLSRTKALGDISYLNNPNLTGNLAFSLQMQIAAAEYYPNLTRPIYLKGYRYNMHFKEKYLLIEMGSYTNTQEEARNAMVPLADLLNRVLHGEN